MLFSAALRTAARVQTVRRLYFVQRLTIEAIAARLHLSRQRVLDALVFRSPAADSLPPGPHRKENP